MLDGVTSLVVGTAPGQLVVYGETPKVEFVTTKINPFDGIDVGLDSTPAFVDLDEPKVKADSEILDSPTSPHDPRAPPYDEERPAVITN